MHVCARLLMATLIGAVIAFSSFHRVGATGSSSFPPANFADASIEHLAHLALDPDTAISSAARSLLRQSGQEGVDALFDAFPRRAADATRRAAATDAMTLRWVEAVEAVSRQKDAAFSRLYWFTDLNDATAAATRMHRPILSLRLLGNLDEDRSCANSRYFRTVLYADPSVSQHLRDNYVLHWASVRPVPHITIDMGDGRKIERTITGNSVHYILDSDGQVLDVLPGLWSAEPFLEVLRETEEISRPPNEISLSSDQTPHAVAVSDPAAVDAMEHESTRQIIVRDLKEWNFEVPIFNNVPEFTVSKGLAEGGMKNAVTDPGGRGRAIKSENAIAVEAGRRPPGKFAVQLAPHRDIENEHTSLRANQLQRSTTEDLDLDAFAAEFPARLSARSKTLMWQKRFGVVADHRNQEQQKAMAAMIARFEHTLAMDTALNRLVLRPRARQWLAEAARPVDLDDFNTRVYAELFLSPLNDPWMGLVPADAYAALQNEGLLDAGE